MSTTKKKKTAREKRVLIASVICAGLIIAGSTFAWFTSTDEVTNRLTSNADYGVSIVETFSPPENWIPGQEVNKDVYAVNTGNIDAFVKEDVSGVLNYTYEKYEATFTAANAIELSSTDVADTEIDGATTMEAGAFLAWTNTSEPTGYKNVQRVSDDDGNRWVPTEAGDYIFRRSISSDTSSDGGAATAPAYTYSGYHYDGGKYYKIVIGNDIDPTVSADETVFDVSVQYSPNAANDKLGATVGEDGVLTSAPTIKYAVLGEGKAEAVALEYEAAVTTGNEDDKHPARLKVTCEVDDANAATGNTYDASAAAARAEIDYLNAKGKSDDAKAEYDQAKADYDYAEALANATNTLIDAAKTRKAAADALTTATENNANALTAVNTAAGAVTVSVSEEIAPTNIVSADIRAALTAAGADSTYPMSVANYNGLTNLWNSIGLKAGEINDDLSQLTNTNVGAADATTAYNELKTDLNDLKTLLSQYKAKYANLVDSNETITHIDTSDANTTKNAIQAQVDNVNTVIGSVTSNDGLKGKVDKYNTAASALAAATAADTAAEGAWTSAVEAYNGAVGSAKSDYEGTIINIGGINKAASIVPTHSANGTPDGTDPQISGTAAYGDYAGAAKKSVSEALTAALNTNKAAYDTALSETKAAESIKNAANGGAKNVTIYVNLADGYEDNWTFDTTTDNTEKATFYLNKILAAGETSEMLIDSVELSSTVTAAVYKEMTFDLNVHLDSAQVTYAEDKSIKADAVSTWDMQATVDQNTKEVSWS